MEAALLAGLILLNAFFAMSEISLVAARPARLQALIEAGDRAARLAAQLGAEPMKFMSTIQIGITSVGLLSGIVGEATLAPPLADWLMRQGMDPEVSDYVSTGLVVALVTYFAIVVGELVPKRIGQVHAEAIARRVAYPIRALSLIARPFVALLSGSTHLLLRPFSIDDSRRSEVTAEEIDAVLTEGSAAGVIEKEEHRMVRNLFRLDDLAVASLMTPRAAMVTLEVSAGGPQLLALLENAPHARYPVVRRTADDIVGVVSARELLLRALRAERLDLAAAAQPALFVPESITARELLESLRRSGDHLAFVVDEYGTVLGLVTRHDLLEAITGAFKQALPEDERAVQRPDGSWLFDGQISLHELFDHLGLRAPPGEEPDYQTLSGLIIQDLGRLPRTAERIRHRGWTFEVVDMDGFRIDRVLAMRGRAPNEADATNAKG